MKLLNTTSIPNYVIRRVLSFCCRELDFPVRRVHELVIRNRNDGGTSGRAWRSGRIVISLGVAFDADFKPDNSPDSARKRVRNGLVHVLAHEVAHLMLGSVGSKTRKSRRYGTTSWGGSERQTIRHERMVEKTFLANEAALLDEWFAEPANVAAKPSAMAEPKRKRYETAMKKVAEWQRKKKLAETKLKHWQGKKRYYERTYGYEEEE